MFSSHYTQGVVCWKSGRAHFRPDKLRVHENSVLLVNLIRIVFSPKLCIYVRKFSNKNKTLRQFSDNPQFGRGNCYVLLPLLSHRLRLNPCVRAAGYFWLRAAVVTFAFLVDASPLVACVFSAAASWAFCHHFQPHRACNVLRRYYILCILCSDLLTKRPPRRTV